MFPGKSFLNYCSTLSDHLQSLHLLLLLHIVNQGSYDYSLNICHPPLLTCKHLVFIEWVNRVIKKQKKKKWKKSHDQRLISFEVAADGWLRRPLENITESLEKAQCHQVLITWIAGKGTGQNEYPVQHFINFSENKIT